MSTWKNFQAKALVGFAVLASIGVASIAPARAYGKDYAHNNWSRHERRVHEWWHEREWQRGHEWRDNYYSDYARDDNRSAITSAHHTTAPLKFERAPP
jgi:hypothetical protein